MKNRQVLIISLILAALVLAVALTCFLLRVRTFEVQVQSDPAFRISEDLSEATDGYLGKSVLLLKSAAVREEIERRYPYVRVKDVEKNVSSKVIVRIVERYELFCLESEDQYVVLDTDGKVLRVETAVPETFDGISSLIRVKLPAGAIGQAVPGEKIVFAREECGEFLQAFAEGLREVGRTEFEARQEFASVDLSFADVAGTGGTVEISGTYGCRIHLDSVFAHGTGAKPFVDEALKVFYGEGFDRETSEVGIRYDSESGKVVSTVS